MRCELCNGDPDEVYVLPRYQSDGKLQTLACLSCAMASGMYCVQHGRPHLGFGDETHACTLCIEAETQLLMEEFAADGNAAGFLRRLQTELPLEEWRLFEAWANNIGEAIDNFPERMILRAVVTLAQRRGQAVRAVVDWIIAAQSVEALVPDEWYDKLEALLERRRNEVSVVDDLGDLFERFPELKN